MPVITTPSMILTSPQSLRRSSWRYRGLPVRSPALMTTHRVVHVANAIAVGRGQCVLVV